MTCICRLPSPGDSWDTDIEVNPRCEDHGPVMDMSPDEYEAIASEIFPPPLDDPAFLPASLTRAIAALGEIAVSSLTLEDAERTARQTLRQLVFRKKNGCFLNEMDHDYV